MTRRDHAMIGNQQATPKPQLPSHLAQAADGSGAKNHSSPRLKVERLHKPQKAQQITKGTRKIEIDDVDHTSFFIFVPFVLLVPFVVNVYCAELTGLAAAGAFRQRIKLVAIA